MMSQHPNQMDQGLVDAPTGAVATDVDDRIDVYPAQTGGIPAPSAPPAGSDSPDGSSKVAQVKDSTVEAGQHVADTAKDQAKNVAAEAKSQAKDLVNQGREELRQQAGDQQARVASGLQALSRELHSMANGSSEQGVAVDLAREVAQRAESASSWLEAREPGQLLDEVRSFARERPGAFIGLAAVAGILAGRLGRGLKEGEPESPRHLADVPAQQSDAIVGQY